MTGRTRAAAVLAAVLLPAAVAAAPGGNPHPVALVRPPSGPLSAMAALGRDLFHDPRLSASGRQSCASCHDPANHYGPPGEAAVMPGGPGMAAEGVRAVPSLAYLEREPAFSIGPDSDADSDADTAVSLSDLAAQSRDAARAVKTATDTAASAANMVPQGGLFWDGRADTLQDQALVPLLNPVEMANPDVEAVAAALRAGGYAPRLAQLFGPGILSDAKLLVSEAMFALARYQIEDASFHPYSSRFDRWLEGRATLTPAEMRGYRLFNDPARANCGGCHVDVPGRDGTPPRFTDGQFEALGVPRNRALAANRDPAHVDLGVCGPYRTDIADQTQYCGMFLTPTLRNVATRHVFFHNGVFRTLREVLDFYAFRDVAPEKVYPRRADGSVDRLDDLPVRYRANLDTADPPFGGHPGDPLRITPQDEADIIAFLGTLTDGDGP